MTLMHYSTSDAMQTKVPTSCCFPV